MIECAPLVQGAYLAADLEHRPIINMISGAEHDEEARHARGSLI